MHKKNGKLKAKSLYPRFHFLPQQISQPTKESPTKQYTLATAKQHA